MWKWDWMSGEECALSCATWGSEEYWALNPPLLYWTVVEAQPFPPFRQSLTTERKLYCSQYKCENVKNMPPWQWSNVCRWIMEPGTICRQMCWIWPRIALLTGGDGEGTVLNCLLDELCALAYMAWLHVGFYLYVSHCRVQTSSVLMFSTYARSLHMQGWVAAWLYVMGLQLSKKKKKYW